MTWLLLVIVGLALAGCVTRPLTLDQVHAALATDRRLVRTDLRGLRLAGFDLRRADLREAKLDGVILDGADLTGADLEEAELAKASLLDAQLVGANLRDADLEAAKLSRADLTRAVLADANLDEAQLDGATLTRANLRAASLDEANLAGADLREADLTEADLTEADLRGAQLVNARLTEARLREANAQKAVLDGADLSRADLREARLAGASLVGARLRDASLRDAGLQEANLTGADLRGADLTGANLWGAVLDRALLSGATLQGATLSSARVEEANLEGVAIIPPADERLLTLPPPPTEAQRARIRSLTVVSRSPVPGLEIIVPRERIEQAQQRGAYWAQPGVALFISGAPPLMLLGVVLMGASAAASTPTATAEEVSLIAAIGRVPLADMLRDHVAEFTSAHTPHRVIRPPDTASGNAVLEADVTGLRLVSGMLTVAVRSRLRWPTWSVPFYEATLVYVSPHSLPAWAENEGEALRVELDGVTRALAERIVEEAFLRYVP